MQHLKDEGCTVIALRDLAKYVDFSKGPKDIYAPIVARLGVTASALRYHSPGEKPQFSWKVKTTRTQTQSAYQVLVASSKETLATNKGDLWDSGRVASDKSAGIIYAGKPLASGKEFYWKVRCWNNPDEAEIKRVSHWIAKELLAEMRKTRAGAFSSPASLKQ